MDSKTIPVILALVLTVGLARAASLDKVELSSQRLRAATNQVAASSNRLEATANPAGTVTNTLDRLHDDITHRFLTSAKQLDKFIGNRQADDESRASLLRLSLKTSYTYEGIGVSPEWRLVKA